eukprot:2646658-Pyramimonas_sp.AAC.1
MGPRPCPWARMQRVALQAQALVAPDYVTGRPRQVRRSAQPRWMPCKTRHRSKLEPMTHPSHLQVPPLDTPRAS